MKELKLTSGSWKPGPLQVIVLLTILQLSITLLTNGFALSQDEAMWHYIGRNWFRNGLVPYTGGVDNKSPLFFAVFGLSDKLFGINYWFPRVLGTVCQSAGIYYLYKIANQLAGRQAGMLAMSFYGLSVLWRSADGRYVSYSETYDVLFTIISFYIFLTAQDKKRYPAAARRAFFISGFLAAIGAGFRLSALFAIAAMFIASFREKRISTILFCLGVLSGILFLALIGFLAGINLHDVYVYGFADNFGAGSTSDRSFLHRMEQLYNMFFYSEVILFYPLLLIYLLIKRKMDWLVLWLVFAFIGINAIGNYARVDLKDLLPAMSLMGAFAVAHLMNTYSLSMRPVMLVVWICFFPKLLDPFISFKKIFTEKFQNPEDFCKEPFILPDEHASKQLGEWVRANTTAGEMVFVAGADGAQVQVYSGRISPSIYFNATQTRLAKERFFQDMQRNKAEMVLVPLYPSYKLYIGADLRSYVDQLVAKDYYFDRCMFNYNIYRIRK